MLGICNYTVILTYLSLISASTGVFITLSGHGHPYLGTFFLLFCGLCDAFDGKVARMKKNRTEYEKSFGIQIDSLSDLMAFGILPASIGYSLIRLSTFLTKVSGKLPQPWQGKAITVLFTAVLVAYVLAALIRLAHFNVMEEQRQRDEAGNRRFYTGLPVTSSALIFPSILLLNYLLPIDITPFYILATLLVGFAFLFKFNVHKPGLRGILIMVGIGALEFALILVFHFFIKARL